LFHSYPTVDDMEFENVEIGSPDAETASHESSDGSGNFIDLSGNDEQALSLMEAYVLGYFIGNGMVYVTSNGSYRWGIVCDDPEILERIGKLIGLCETTVNFAIKEHTGYYSLIALTNLEYLAKKYLCLFYPTGKIKVSVPSEILNSKYNARHKFYEGMAISGLNRNRERSFLEEPRFCVDDKLLAASIYYIMNSVGFKGVAIYESVSEIKFGAVEYPLFWISKLDENITWPNEIRCIKNLGYCGDEEYVYDLETFRGTFLAGVGSIIVANTDSVFIKFKTPTTARYESEYDGVYAQTVVTENNKQNLKNLKTKCMSEALVLGKEAATAATTTLFKHPISLEFEKVYAPLFLLQKKKYIGMLYSENAEQYDKIDNKGVVLKRRDNFILMRDTYKKMIDIFLDEGKHGLGKVLEMLNAAIDTLIDGQNIDLDNVAITKAYKGPYKSLNIPHVVLARKLNERNPTNLVQSNDRITYVFVDTGLTKKAPQYTKVEDPEYVKEHGLPIDTEYYIKFLMNPVCEILELFMKDPKSIFKAKLDEYNKQRLTRLRL